MPAQGVSTAAGGGAAPHARLLLALSLAHAGSQQRRRLQDDNWFAVDKLQHVFLCLLAACLAYAVFSRWAYTFRNRLWASFAAGVTLGVLKEFGDYLGLWTGVLSSKDLVADVLGAAIAGGCLYLVERRFGPPATPASVAGSSSAYAASSSSAWSSLGLTRTQPRLIDLEQGLVYGQRILRQYGTSIRAFLPAAKARLGLSRGPGYSLMVNERVISLGTNPNMGQQSPRIGGSK